MPTCSQDKFQSLLNWYEDRGVLYPEFVAPEIDLLSVSPDVEKIRIFINREGLTPSQCSKMFYNILTAMELKETDYELFDLSRWPQNRAGAGLNLVFGEAIDVAAVPPLEAMITNPHLKLEAWKTLKALSIEFKRLKKRK